VTDTRGRESGDRQPGAAIRRRGSDAGIRAVESPIVEARARRRGLSHGVVTAASRIASRESRDNPPARVSARVAKAGLRA